MKHRHTTQIQIFMHTDLPDGLYDTPQHNPGAAADSLDGTPLGWRPTPLLPKPDSRPIQFTTLGLLALLPLRGTTH